MHLEERLEYIASADLESKVNDLKSSGWSVVVLPAGIIDRSSFFRAVKQTIALDPDVVGDSKWDALSDSMWSGIDGLASDKFAIIWPDYKMMAEAAPEDFAVARSMLVSLSASLGNVEATVGNAKQVLIILS